MSQETCLKGAGPSGVLLAEMLWQSVLPEKHQLREVNLDKTGSQRHQATDQNPSYLNLGARDTQFRGTAGLQ